MLIVGGRVVTELHMPPNGCCLYPTLVCLYEVVKEALQQDAAAVIFSHNHPSGVAEPSKADEKLTTALKQALSLVDVKVLDRFIVVRAGTVSFAERGADACEGAEIAVEIDESAMIFK